MPVLCCSTANADFQSFDDVLKHLNCLGLFHMDLGLDRMKRAIEALNIKIPCPIIQVVGTNGKGSTATFLHSIALAHGFRAGIFTSPHFLSPVERIRMNEKYLPESAWAMIATQALRAVNDLTYFELLTVMALVAFAFSEPDVLIFEAGLGGHNDATTAIGADILCITPIDLDHTNILGNTIEAIATDKVHAMHKNMYTVITAPQQKCVQEIIHNHAKSLNLSTYNFDDFSELPETAEILAEYELGIKGKHQYTNAQQALTTWHHICKKQGWFIDKNAIERGLAQAFIPGRFQKVRRKEDFPNIILDGAHNMHSLTTLIECLLQENIRPQSFIFNCMSDKQPERMASLFESYFKQQNYLPSIIIPRITDNERALEPAQTAKLFTVPTIVCENMQEALEIARTNNGDLSLQDALTDAPIVVCGSLYLLAEYYKLFPKDLER